MYNFTSFAVSLNELEKGMEAILAPTDCRLRPDIRNMENGNMGMCLLQEILAHEKGLGGMAEGRSMQETLPSVSRSQSSLNSFSSCAMNILLNGVWCQFSPSKAWESRCIPGGSQGCYPVLWCVCMFVSLGGAADVLHLLWSLSGETCGEQTCSAALVFVRGNTWPNTEKKSLSLSYLIWVCSCCLSTVSLRDKTPTFQFQLCVCSSSFSEMSFKFLLPETVYSKCFLMLKWALFHFSGLSCVFCLFVFVLLSNQFLLKHWLDVASKEKERLEEKQRAARKERAKDEVEWHTR